MEIQIKPWDRMIGFLPVLSKTEKESLRESIQKHGVKNRILILLDGRIMDGFHRWEISQELKVDCPHDFVDLNDDDAFALGIVLNVARRQLSFEQIKDIRERQKRIALELRNQGKTQEEVAKIVGVTHQTVDQWENNNVSNASTCNAYNVALDCRLKLPKGAQETIIERYKKGETQEQIAANFKIARPRVSQIIQKAEKVQRQQRQAISRLKVDAIIKHKDAVEFLNSISDKSVDLLLTDPPYSTEIKNLDAFVDSWLYLALEKLKDTGQAYIFIGAYAWELRTYLNAVKKVETRFGEPQILVWTYKNTLGPDKQNGYSLNWQAILYLRAPKAPKLNETQLINKLCVQEFNAPDGRSGTRYHRWEKPLELAKRLIKHSVIKDSLVIDPFAGTGTFLLAAAELGCQNIGSEIDSEMVNIATTRGCVQTG